MYSGTWLAMSMVEHGKNLELIDQMVQTMEMSLTMCPGEGGMGSVDMMMAMMLMTNSGEGDIDLEDSVDRMTT